MWAPQPPLELPEHGPPPHPEVPVGRRDQVALFPPPGALRKADSDLQKAVSAGGRPWAGPAAPSEPPVSPQCLVEAVLVLDVLCRQDPSFLYRALPCVRALRTRLCGDTACVRALLPIAQFFLHHGERLLRWRTAPGRGTFLFPAAAIEQQRRWVLSTHVPGIFKTLPG